VPGDRRAGAVGALILAAGGSSRLGQPKQLLPLGGRPLLQHVIDAAAAAGLAGLVVVLGHDAEAVAAAVSLPPGARTTVNPRYRAGQSTSLHAGLRALAPEASAALVLLGDQPTVPASAIRAVVEAAGDAATPIVQARYGGRPGHPVLLRREIWEELLATGGDRGARELMAARPELVTGVEVGGTAPPDVDTRQDYELLRAAWEARHGR
jgi:molybdenum cofactor cytidylyltransferase